MTLTIKDEVAICLATELSDLTGEDIEQAVMTALRERLQRVQAPISSLAARLLEIGKDCAGRLNKTPPIEHGELLYDDDGLPRTSK